MKLKAGDQVRVLNLCEKLLNKYHKTVGLPTEMTKHEGSICTIRRSWYSDNYNVNLVTLEEFRFSWIAEHFRLIDHQERLNRKYGVTE
jgi:hypothetical protein